MIEINSHQLENGLRIVHNREATTKMAAVNLLYCVGAKDEDPKHTGFAHLMEHLMFSGTPSAPYFDTVVQMAKGENNAWTNNDITNYYEVLPVENIETALILEADRMVNLSLTDESVENQRSVVAEEFKQRCLNVPYGDMTHLWRALAYKVHPYRWPTIGLDVQTIENAEKSDILSLYKKFYCPSNAILSVVGDIDSDEVFRLAEKSFGDIEKRHISKPACHEQEPEQKEKRELLVARNVPHRMIFKAYHMPDRLSKGYIESDLISDILSNGRSSRFFKKFISQGYLFSNIDASITGEVEPGVLRMQATLLPGVGFEEANNAICEEINRMIDTVTDYEVEKYANKFESNRLFTNINIDERAANIAYYEMLGNADMINSEIDNYRIIGKQDIKSFASSLFNEENSSTIFYDIAK
jgi:zinc protease